jgi:hypothetical protein
MIKNCEKEVIELHRFFEEWLNGTIANSDETLSRVNTALGDDFLIISPNAKQTKKPALLHSLKNSHGAWNNGRIWIKHINRRLLNNDLCLITYEEWQNKGDGENDRGRLSSALFRKNKEAPCGVQWVHLHEVWIP